MTTKQPPFSVARLEATVSPTKISRDPSSHPPTMDTGELPCSYLRCFNLDGNSFMYILSTCTVFILILIHIIIAFVVCSIISISRLKTLNMYDSVFSNTFSNPGQTSYLNKSLVLKWFSNWNEKKYRIWFLPTSGISSCSISQGKIISVNWLLA